MARLALAIRMFFRVLRDADLARRVAELLAISPGASSPAASPPGATPQGRDRQNRAKEPGEPRQKPRHPKEQRNDALNLLAMLQREARFVDFVQEPIDAYSDEQIGAAARDVHRDCAVVLNRVFGLRRLTSDEEGAAMEIPSEFNPGRIRLTGTPASQSPMRGTVRHHGWEATRCELPAWSGSAGAAHVVAPVEVELS